MQNINSIIFDLGGVILNIDYNKTSEAFKNLGVINIDEMYSQSSANQLFQNLEEGKISEIEFFDSIREESGIILTNEEIINAWNKMLLSICKETLGYIKTLRSKYKVYLLSNTNTIHLKQFYHIYDQTIGKEPFDSLFDATYYSHLIGIRKPKAAAYEYVIDKNDLKVNECVFIDDSIQNIEGAKLAGLNTIFFTSEMRVATLGL